MAQPPHAPLPPALPQELSPEQADTLRSLGPVLEEYRPDPSSRRRNAVILWAGVGVGLLALACSAGMARDAAAEANPPDAVALACIAAAMGVFGVSFLAACGRRLRQLRRSRGVRVLVHALGLARVNGDDVQAVRWDDVEQVDGSAVAYHAEAVRVGARFILTVRAAGGGCVQVDSAMDHLAGMAALYHRVGTETASRLLPRLLAATEAGETVSFGQLGVSRQGLHCQGRVLSWGEVEGVEWREAVRVRRRGAGWLDWWGRRLFLLLNVHAFLRLVEHYLGKERAGPSLE